MTILENIDIDIDMTILENIDNDIDKDTLENIDIDIDKDIFDMGIWGFQKIMILISILIGTF